MDKKRLIKNTVTIIAIVLPFGLLGVGGYYGYKAYKKKKEEKEKEKDNG